MVDVVPHFGRVVVVREDLLLVCQGRVESAVLLSILEYWTRVKLGMLNQLEHENEAREKEGLEPIEGDDLWIWKSHDELVSDSLGLLSRYSLRKAVKHLTELGLLETRNNPRYRWDKTTQYRLNVGALREALKKAHETLGAHECAISHLRECENEPSIVRNRTNNTIDYFREKKIYPSDIADSDSDIRDSSTKGDQKKKRRREASATKWVAKIAASLFYSILKKELGVEYQEYGKLMKLTQKWGDYCESLLKKEDWDIERVIYLTVFAIYWQLETRPTPDPVYLFGKPAETHASLRKLAKERKSLFEKIRAKAEAALAEWEGEYEFGTTT